MPASGLNRRFTEMHRSSERGITLAHVCALADLYRSPCRRWFCAWRSWDGYRAVLGRDWKGDWSRSAQQLLGIDANPPIQHLLPRRYVDLAILAYHQGKLHSQLARMLRMDRVAARMKVEEARSRFNAEEDDTYKLWN